MSGELDEMLDRVDEDARVRARAQDADRLELELTATRAGLPDVPSVHLFLDNYGGAVDEDAVLIAWARHIDVYGFLSPAQRFRAQLDQ